MPDFERSLGKLEGQVEDLRGDIKRLEDLINELAKDIKEHKALLDTARGGWKVIMWLLGVSSTISGAIGFLLTKLFHGQ